MFLSPRALPVLVLLLTLPASASAQQVASASPSRDSLANVMKRDLRNLLVSEEAYFADHKTYAASAGPSNAANVAFIELQSGSDLTLSAVSSTGWRGVLSNVRAPGGPLYCGAFVGSGGAPNPAVKAEGTPTCWDGPARETHSLPGSDVELLASMKADLRNLVTAQEAHFADYGRYATSLGSQESSAVLAFSPSGGNQVTLSHASEKGYTAEVSNPGLQGLIKRCGVYIGTGVAPNAENTAEGMIACYE